LKFIEKQDEKPNIEGVFRQQSTKTVSANNNNNNNNNKTTKTVNDGIISFVHRKNENIKKKLAMN